MGFQYHGAGPLKSVLPATAGRPAIACLLAGTREQIEVAIQNRCVTVIGARLAVATVGVPAGSGIVKRQVEQTIANLGAISDPGMAATDLVILDAMMAE